jgi:hypothetical protein
MANQSVQALRAIRSQINDLSAGEQDQVLEQLLEQSMALLDGFENPDHAFFKSRKKVALEGLSEELQRYQQVCRGECEKVEKINRFSLARQEAHHLLGKVLSAC